MAQDKVIIAELSLQKKWSRFIAFHANVWGVVTNNIYKDIIVPELQPEKIGLISGLTVFTFSENKIPYLEVATESEVIINEGTFFINKANKLLLIHFKENKTPFDFSRSELEISFILGFYSSSREVVPEWNDQQYYKRLLSAPIIEKIKDDLYFSKQVYSKGKITFDDGDYKFLDFSGGFEKNKQTGSLVRVLEWSGNIDDGNPDYDDFEVLQQGVISKVNESNIIDVIYDDLRTSLTKTILSNILNTANFSDIKNADKEYLLPQIWGKCYQAPCLCLNQDVNKGLTGSFNNYIFMVCDASLTGYSENDDNNEPLEIASDSIKVIYINGVEIELTPPSVVKDSTNGIYTVTIPYSNFSKLDDSSNVSFENMDKLSLDIEGYLNEADDLVSNGMEIIRELLYQVYGYTYTATFYDLTAWALFETDTSITYNIGYFIEKPLKMQRAIENISNDMLGTFIWDDNLKFSFDNDDFVEIEAHIYKHEFYPFDYIPKISSDSKQVLAAFRVGMRKKWNVKDSEERFDWIKDETNREDAAYTFNSDAEKDFPTMLYDDADLANYQARVHNFGDISNDLFTINVPWEYRQADKGQYFAVEYDLPNKRFKGWILAQTQSVRPNGDLFQVEMTLRVYRYGYDYYEGTALSEENDLMLTDENGYILTIEE